MAKGVARSRRNRMMQNPYCHWCGRRVRYWKPSRGETLPPDFATIDHLNSRNQAKPRPEGGRWVLSCRECNMARARAEEQAKPTEEHWRESGRYPRLRGK